MKYHERDLRLPTDSETKRKLTSVMASLKKYS